mmetsp:Transcript_570/g.1049  ORF Transcript_570/g.1049 Transcript_570/m.1049 type:complete len:221 (+) Transcript_570:2-664(+)
MHSPHVPPLRLQISSRQACRQLLQAVFSMSAHHQLRGTDLVRSSVHRRRHMDPRVWHRLLWCAVASQEACFIPRWHPPPRVQLHRLCSPCRRQPRRLVRHEHSLRPSRRPSGTRLWASSRPTPSLPSPRLTHPSSQTHLLLRHIRDRDRGRAHTRVCQAAIKRPPQPTTGPDGPHWLPFPSLEHQPRLQASGSLETQSSLMYRPWEGSLLAMCHEMSPAS